LGWSALDLLSFAEADLLLEASPVNLEQGAEPGLSCIRTAMRRGMHVVTPNKGPMVLAYRELHDLAAEQGVELRFDGTVAGGLPVLYLAQRDLRGALVHHIEAVPNLVTGYVMDMLAEGTSWDDALASARQEGVLEADASWDLDGWDTAAKLLILVNALPDSDKPARLEDVARTGIMALDPVELRSARERGERYRLLARAERRPDGEYTLSVAPTPLPAEHPLGKLGRKQMGVLFSTDIWRHHGDDRRAGPDSLGRYDVARFAGHLFIAGLQVEHRQRWQGQRSRVGLPLPGYFIGRDASPVVQTAAAVLGSVAVE
jgi:homoserine dehydrogenase